MNNVLEKKQKNQNGVSQVTRFRFSISYMCNSLLWMTGLSIVSAVLLPQHLREAVGTKNSIIVYGYVNAVTAVASLIANLIFGNLSDRTRSRFGRRTPWILSGSILAGITLFLTGISDNPWIIGLTYCACMFGLNMMLAPVIATLSDRVPDDMRATISAFNSAGTTVGSSLGTMIGAFFITKQILGFLTAGVIMGVAGICTIMIWPKETSSEKLPPVKGGVKEFFISFKPPLKNARDFWLAFVGRSLLIFSYYMILNYQLYILQDYIGLDTKQSATTISTMSVITMFVALVGSLVSGTISDKLNRRKLPVNIASLLMAIGFFIPWVLKTSFSMLVFASFAGLGYAIYGAVDQALNVDVLPNKDEAGKDLGILNIATTLGQTLGPIVTSALVMMGGYQLVFPIAIVFSIMSCLFIQMIRSVK